MALDPEFAMAHLYLGYIYNNLLGEFEKAREYYEKARTLSHKVTEKERLLIEAEYVNSVEMRTEKWLEILHKIVEKYPREKQAHLELTEYYRKREMFSEVIKHAEIILALDPSRGDAYEELAFAYANTGNDEMALEYLEKGAAAIPGDPRMNLTMGQFYVKMGKIDEAIGKFKAALDIKSDYTIENFLAYAYAMKEKYGEAIQWSRKYSENPLSAREKAKGYWHQGFYHYWLGNFKQAIEDLQTAWNSVQESGDIDYMSEFLMGYFNYQRGKLDLSRTQFKGWHDYLITRYPKAGQDRQSFWVYWSQCGLGMNDIKEGNIDSARSHLEKMAAWLPKVNPTSNWGYHELLGRILLAEKSYDEVISTLEDVKQREMPWIWNTSSIFGYNFNDTQGVLAKAYKASGDLDAAIEIYEQLTDPNPENRKGRLVYPKNYYYLAQCYEMTGRKAKAVKLYEKFLSLWKDADESITEIEDARKRVAGLQ